MPCIAKRETGGTASPDSVGSNCSIDTPADASETKRATQESKPNYPELRLPLEMKMTDGEKPALQTTCDIAAGHIWGPYRLTRVFKNAPPLGENNASMAHRHLNVSIKDVGDFVVRVNEENAWIKLVQETELSDASNVDIILEVFAETISVVAMTSITSGSLLHGVVRVTSNLSGPSKNGSPSPTVNSPSFSGSAHSQSNSNISIGGPKRDKKCPYCGIFFSSMDTLSAHMSTYCSRRPHVTLSVSNTASAACNSSIDKSADKTSGALNESGESGNTDNAGSQGPVFQWPTRTTPGKRINGNPGNSSQTSSSHSTRPGICANGRSNSSSIGSPSSLLNPPIDFSSVLAGSGGSGANTDAFANFAATLASLNRFKSANIPPPPSSTESQPIATPKSEEKATTPYCQSCQRYYSNSIYPMHVGLSRQMSRLAAENNVDVSHLAEAAKRIGLVITAPLITAAGYVYVPVHPDCSGCSSGNGSIGLEITSGKAPLDLRTAKPSGEESQVVEKETVVGSVSQSLLTQSANSLLTNFISGLIGSQSAHAPPPLPPPPPPSVPSNSNWLFGGKLPDATTMELFLQAVASNQSHHLGPLSEGSRASLDAGAAASANSASEIQRPYLCTNCQTRFQAYSTFKAHQQYYCQGRRKGSMTSDNTSGSFQGSTAVSTPQSTKSSGSSDRSHSPKKRRLNDVNDGCPVPVRIKAPLSPQSQGGDSSEPSPPSRSINGDWEHVGGGSSELRCRLCGYVGQTPRGMKMHSRLHECNAAPVPSRTKSTKAHSPKSPNTTTESNTSPPQNFPTQSLC